MGNGGMCRDLAESILLPGFTIVRISIMRVKDSLSVFWFYRNQRPVFHEKLVGKEKGQLEGVNVIWFRWPRETDEWLKMLSLVREEPEMVDPWQKDVALLE
jgi:hypothetical protein